MTDELTAETLRQLKMKGLTDKAIGRKYGKPESSVRNLRRQYHIPGMTKSQAGRRAASRRNGGTGLIDRFGTEEKLRAEIERLQAEGHTSLRKLADALGASMSTIQYWKTKFAAVEKASRRLSTARPSTAHVPVPIKLECEDCDIYEEATLPASAATAARSAWKRIHPGKGACQVGGTQMREAYERKWGQP